MLAASGRAESEFESSKSQRTVSTPQACKCDSNLEDEKRETPITRRETPAMSDALFAMRARVGPIFPPTPKMTMSPSRAASVRTTASDGSLRSSSSSSISRTEVFWRDVAIRCSQFIRSSGDWMPIELPSAIVLESPRHGLPSLSVPFQNSFYGPDFSGDHSNRFTISPEEFGSSHALAHHDDGGHPGGNAAEGDRGLESDRGRLETVSRSQPGRLLCRGRRRESVRYGNDDLVRKSICIGLDGSGGAGIPQSRD